MTSLGESQFEVLPVEALQLDVQNPRIAQWISMYDRSPTPEQIALALGAGSSEEGALGPSVRALKESIRTNRGIIHPIVVNRNETGALVVIEGCRCCSNSSVSERRIA
jgi:hypothetical protein